jgi:hypothetical protein
MTSQLTIRRTVPIILGLYFLAQVIGIAPLIAVHLHHLYQSQMAIAEDLAVIGVVDHGHDHNGHHQHGAGDPADQCCTVHHHLAAVLPVDLGAKPRSCASASVGMPLPDSLIGAEPALPDRPPKLLST